MGKQNIKVGDTFQYGDVTLVAKESNTCEGCYFYKQQDPYFYDREDIQDCILYDERGAWLGKSLVFVEHK